MRMGTCMCGDPYCPSCGPAQGNTRCPNCGQWAFEGECVDPEECERANREADEALAEEWQWQLDHEEEIESLFMEEELNGEDY